MAGSSYSTDQRNADDSRLFKNTVYNVQKLINNKADALYLSPYAATKLMTLKPGHFMLLHNHMTSVVVYSTHFTSLI